ncbi:MAG TPA: phospholipase D-like domain-containing protein [Candidatus Saccharimonadales bacterium]|nr:phospholipase D-like domain-containing protein [Candidatus Saccharimonadales bacterium]
MFSLKQRAKDLSSSRLFDQNNFYESFFNDLKRAKKEVIIESPFITTKRMKVMLPLLMKLTKHGVRVVINTKPPDEHEFQYRLQAERAISELQKIGVRVLLTNGHHRKLAIIDRSIIWEGSLNILSHNDSCEVMRRMSSELLAKQMLSFLRLEKFIV